MQTERRHALVVWGATGYTGRLVAEAVAARPPRGAWAVAGRDRGKVEALAARLGASVVVADADDPGSLAAMAGGARAIVSAVGPYARYGTPLVDACVAAGTDLADLTGEVGWMRKTIERSHEAAQSRGMRIVHACGFDSVPSDLGVWLVQREAMRRYGRACAAIEHVIGPMRGGVSGGTIASATTALLDPEARRWVLDPNALAPQAALAVRWRDPWWPVWHRDLRAWSAPFVMAEVNARVMRRTGLLQGSAPVRYRERWRVGGFVRTAAVGIASRLGVLAGAVPAMRAALLRRLPAPGEGPDADALARGRFASTLIGRVEGSTTPVVVRIEAPFDPGYAMAARMLAAVGTGLADGAFPGAPAGVITPAALGGEALLARLHAAGIRFLVGRVG